MDFTLFKLINGLTGNAAADAIGRFLAVDIAYVLVGLVALTVLVPWRRCRSERRTGAVVATSAAAAALALNQPLGHLIDRVRPYVEHPAQVHLLIARSRNPSFPSDHATGAFALAFGIWLYDRAIGTVLLVLAAAMGIARVFVGTHYPSDVVAGALMGAAVATVLSRIPIGRLLTAVRTSGAPPDPA